MNILLGVIGVGGGGGERELPLSLYPNVFFEQRFLRPESIPPFDFGAIERFALTHY